MKFSEFFITCCENVGCTNAELSKAAGVDASLISRLKNGSRTIASESKTLMKLSEGLSLLARDNGITEFPKDIYQQFNHILAEDLRRESQRLNTFSHNTNSIFEQLNISNVHLSKYLSIDPSLMSRIRRGQRKPADMDLFILNLANYLKKYYFSESQRAFYAKEFGIPFEELSYANFPDLLSDWLINRTLKNENSISHFLEKLNDFNLEEYIDAISFNAIHIPQAPFLLPTKRHYYGFQEMRTGTIDFLKMVATAKKVGTVTIFSDFTIEKLSEDVNFSKKWMFGLAMMIKRGNHINQIHYLDRPFKEIMLGLEAWIPLYMTGQISPYYMRSKTNQAFCHLLFCAPEVAALSGEAVAGFEDEGRYLLTNLKKDMNYFEKRSQKILSLAMPLMEIYMKEQAKQYYNKQYSNAEKPGNRKHILSSPALYTIPDALLVSMLDKSSLNLSGKDNVLQQAAALKQRMDTILNNYRVTDILPILDEKEFSEGPMTLQLTDVFESSDIPYSYSDYLSHLEGMEAYKRSHKNYRYQTAAEKGYKNIQIFIHEGVSVTVQKSNFPNIVFVIKHKRLCEAFEDMEFLIRDK